MSKRGESGGGSESLRSSAPRRADPSSLWPDDWGSFAGMESFPTACQRCWVTSPWRITFTGPYARPKQFSGLTSEWQSGKFVWNKCKDHREKDMQEYITVECRTIHSCRSKRHRIMKSYSNAYNLHYRNLFSSGVINGGVTGHVVHVMIFLLWHFIENLCEKYAGHRDRLERQEKQSLHPWFKYRSQPCSRI